VSTVAHAGTLSEKKDGWRLTLPPDAGIDLVTGLDMSAKPTSYFSLLKSQKTNHVDTWTLPGDLLPWGVLDRLYHANWNLSRPLLLENSPPEIMHAERLSRQFSQHGPVKFVVVTRSPCNEHCGAHVALRRLNHTMNLIQRFGKGVFLLRYEDLCGDVVGAAKALDVWEPGLGQVNAHAVPTKHRTARPGNTSMHAHVQMSVTDFCRKKAVPAWPYQDVLELDSTDVDALGGPDGVNAILDFFGYEVQMEAAPTTGRGHNKFAPFGHSRGGTVRLCTWVCVVRWWWCLITMHVY